LGVRGTRILVAALFEYLEDGVTLGEFVELLLDVTQEQAERVLGNVSRLGGVWIHRASRKHFRSHGRF
jgi:hypothetical protein